MFIFAIEITQIMPFTIFDISNELTFEKKALEVFRYQYKHSNIYSDFVDGLKINPNEIDSIDAIPFLPIEVFKTHKIISDQQSEKVIFTSSGTTGIQTSKHFVADLDLYEQSMFTGFKNQYGNPEDYCILALLPSYLERTGSSLVYMMDNLISKSENLDSGFYLDNFEELAEVLKKNESKEVKTILVGVTFALLDFSDLYSFQLKNTIVIETGGMKGRRKEMIREEVHNHLKKGFGLENIHSEYGMTELLSQAWSKGQGVFSTPNWMRIIIRDTRDPFSYRKDGKSGGINIIDLANYYSCSFLATSDLGKKNGAYFEILGRFDNSDIRGCSLLID